MNTAAKRLKVLVISHLYPDESFGVSDGFGGVFIREQLRALNKLCDIRVVIPRDCVPRRGASVRQWWDQVATLPAKFNDDGLALDIVRFAAPPPRRHFLLGYGAAALLPILHRVRAIRREFAFDLIHAHTTVPDGLSAVWLGTMLKVPIVITSHGGDVYSVPANLWNRATLRYTLSRASCVIAVSSNLKERIVALGVPPQKLKIIPNGFDPSKFRIDGKTSERVDDDASEKIILFLGHLITRKDPLILLQAFKRLLVNTSQAVRLVMVGDGFLRKQVKAQVLQLGLTQHVDLLGQVPHLKVADLLGSADLLCLPSRAEGWPTVIFEALSMGVPVVASRVGGVPEAICSEDYGLLVEPRDVDGLTHALERAIETSWDKRKIRAYAAGFTWDNIAELLREEYRGVVLDATTATK